ncbi:hypothetical protein Tco_1386338 [Tanacetum coccineum]
MFEEGYFDDDFDDTNDMVNEKMDNVEGYTVNAGGAVNTATTGVSAASASFTTAGVSISTAKPRTPPTTTTTAFEDEDLTISQTFVKMRSEKAKEKRVAFRDVEESVRSTKILPTIDPKDKGKGIMQEPENPPKNTRKAQIQMDEELAMRLHEEEKAELERTFTYNQLKNKSLEEIQKLYEREKKWINDFVPMDFKMVKDSEKKDDDSQKQAESSKKRPRVEHDKESVKKQKLEDDAEKEELRACLNIVLGDDIAINVESLATKYPIVDWKTHFLTENMMYHQIIKADGSSKNYKIFSEMLDDFDRQDVVDLYRVVKERYETISPEGYDRLLWGDLITLFESSEEDEIWKGQQDYK